jgi:hypothetical protein
MDGRGFDSRQGQGIFLYSTSSRPVPGSIQPSIEWIPGARDSAVGTVTGYGLDDRGVGVRVPVGSRIFSYPRRPDRLWDPPILLSNQ